MTIKEIEMDAVFKHGGRQYRVQEGEFLLVDRFDADKGSTVTFDKVLVRGKDVGLPIVEGASVTATVMSPLVKDKKIYTLKYRRRKASSKSLKGHRQQYTRVRIDKIS